MERLVSISEAASALGVSITTLRRWEASGKVVPEHTAGGHRRYTLVYARASSHDRKDDLEPPEAGGRSAGMIVAHKIALNPNKRQATYFAKAAGTARFAYNWALAEWQRQYEAWKADNRLPKPNEVILRCQLNAIKHKQFPWMLEVTKCAPQMAILQLGKAFENFFAGRAKYPTFRKQGVHDRFTLTNDKFRIDGCRIRITNLGWVRMRESLRFTGKIMSATISRVADRWFVGIAVDTQDLSNHRAENQGVVGVDLGV